MSMSTLGAAWLSKYRCGRDLALPPTFHELKSQSRRLTRSVTNGDKICQGEITCKTDLYNEEDPCYKLIQDRELVLSFKGVFEPEDQVRGACQYP